MLRSILTRVKDDLLIGMNSNVVYKIPCNCGKVYVGETIRRLETRIKEHRTACMRGEVEKSALAEHAWEEQHPILWEEVTVEDQVMRQKELLIKEALNIHLVPEEERLNRDVGIQIPACWKPLIKRH